MSSICITLGEPTENHYGKEIFRESLSEHFINATNCSRNSDGYTVEELYELKHVFEVHDCVCEYIRLDEIPVDTTKELEPAAVLLVRNGVEKIVEMYSDTMISHLDVFEELKQLEWDAKYWDRRRQKVLNKRARWNLCFSNYECEPDYANGKNRIINIDDLQLRYWKRSVETLMNNLLRNKNTLECEGNYYYHPKNCGIGFHGDGERKKTIASSFGADRKIVWIWYENCRRKSERVELNLHSGDMYFMSEKATGWDWKLRSKPTLRHAAGSSKYTV